MSAFYCSIRRYNMILLFLPAELTEEIVSTLSPSDVLSLSRTCSTLYAHANARLAKLARAQQHASGYALTANLQEVSFWFDRKGSGSILEWSAVHGQFRTFVKLLADPGMDIIRADEYGVTMLHRLCGSGKLMFVKTLVQSLEKLQLSIVPVDACLLTPLHFAAGRNRADVVAFLIEAGAEVNARDNHGNTALHIAAVTGSCGAIPPLVKAGADVAAKTRFGWTPVDQASITRHHDAVDVLQGFDSGQPCWEARENAIGQFLSLSPCPKECYNPLNDELLYEDPGCKIQTPNGEKQPAMR